MHSPIDVRRVIVVVLDGLRPDAIDEFDLKELRRLSRIGASSMCARTVAPSLTWPALTSLMTGVEPNVHGILEDAVHFPRPRARLNPLPELLGEAGYPSYAFMGAVPPLYRLMAKRIAKGLGIAEALFAGKNALEVLKTARPTLTQQREGFVFMHWADADIVGHQHCWMSKEYGEAARVMDAALDQLVDMTSIAADPNSLLILLADHGGGGVVDNHHADPHPLNWTIPFVMVGGAVVPQELNAPSLLDVPATVAWALGASIHPSYTGRVLSEAFDVAAEPAVA
ncbi:MAG: alkaline phosphatase family protein [Gemmatimonadaceae bacterium]